MSTPYLQEVAAREAQSKADAKKGCAAIVVIVGAILWGLSTCLGENDTPQEKAAKARERLRYTAQLQAIRTVEAYARDPESVQTRNLVTAVRDTTWVVCGEYNAKNGFGGYVGFQGFAVSSKGDFATATQNTSAYALMLAMCAR